MSLVEDLMIGLTDHMIKARSSDLQFLGLSIFVSYPLVIHGRLSPKTSTYLNGFAIGILTFLRWFTAPPIVIESPAVLIVNTTRRSIRAIMDSIVKM